MTPHDALIQEAIDLFVDRAERLGHDGDACVAMWERLVDLVNISDVTWEDVLEELQSVDSAE